MPPTPTLGGREVGAEGTDTYICMCVCYTASSYWGLCLALGACGFTALPIGTIAVTCVP